MNPGTQPIFEFMDNYQGVKFPNYCCLSFQGGHRFSSHKKEDFKGDFSLNLDEFFKKMENFQEKYRISEELQEKFFTALRTSAADKVFDYQVMAYGSKHFKTVKQFKISGKLLSKIKTYKCYPII